MRGGRGGRGGLGGGRLNFGDRTKGRTKGMRDGYDFEDGRPPLRDYR